MTNKEVLKQLKAFMNKITKAEVIKEPYQYGWVEGYMTLEDSEALKLAINTLSAIEDIKAEIEEVTKCPYGTCVGAGKCANTNDCMLMGEHALKIIERHISGKEQE